MVATVQDVHNVDMTNSIADAGVDDGRISCILADEVPCYVNTAEWGACAKLAESLVAAHLITVALKGGTGASGPVVSESAGGLSRSYAAPSATTGSAGFWQSTSFGQRYLQLKITRITTPMALCDTIVAV